MMIRMIGCGLLLLPCAAFDLKTKRIPWIYCILCGAAGVLLHLLLKDLALWELIAGVLFGSLFIPAALISKGRIGCGDGIMMTAAGAWCGFSHTLSAVFVSFFLTAVYGILRQVLWKKRDGIPFAPFLLAGNAILFFLERGQV